VLPEVNAGILENREVARLRRDKQLVGMRLIFTFYSHTLSQTKKDITEKIGLFYSYKDFKICLIDVGGSNYNQDKFRTVIAFQDNTLGGMRNG